MAQVGDKVLTLTHKVGQASRTGEVTEVIGGFLKIRWDGGSETLLSQSAVLVREPERSAKQAAGVGSPRSRKRRK